MKFLLYGVAHNHIVVLVHKTQELSVILKTNQLKFPVTTQAFSSAFFFTLWQAPHQDNVNMSIINSCISFVKQNFSTMTDYQAPSLHLTVSNTLDYIIISITSIMPINYNNVLPFTGSAQLYFLSSLIENVTDARILLRITACLLPVRPANFS